MRSFRTQSLRQQLLLMGLGSALLPLVLLLGVVFAASNSDEVFEQPTAGHSATLGTTSESTVPAVVPLAALVLAAAAVAGIWWWSRRAVRPLIQLTEATNAIEESSLGRRIELTGESREVQALADGFDRMLQRLAESAEVQRRLVEDTSHELRTPLAALAINNEVILSNPSPSLEEYRESTLRGEALISRLNLTVEELLSAAHDRQNTVRQTDNDLVAIVDRVVTRHRMLSNGTPVRVNGPDRLLLGIHGASMERALSNLVDNASRFSPPDGAIDVDIDSGPPASISVTDYGPGIGEGQLDRIFERYFRGDGEGSGIGLAIVKQVAEAHGRIDVVSPIPGHDHGTRFTLTFGVRSDTGAMPHRLP